VDVWCVRSRRRTAEGAYLRKGNVLGLASRQEAVLDVETPIKCDASEDYMAVTIEQKGLHMFSCDGDLVHTVPDSKPAHCFGFHPNPTILAIGCSARFVQLWDLQAQCVRSSFKETFGYIVIVAIQCTPVFRLFLSSWRNTASIVTLVLNEVARVALEGHTALVNDILSLPSSNQCVTCSRDVTPKIWNCETGSCLHTLTQHSSYTAALALHPTMPTFACASYDNSINHRLVQRDTRSSASHSVFNMVVYFSIGLVLSDLPGYFSFDCRTLEITSAQHVGAVGVGVVSCNAATGEVDPVVIRTQAAVESIAFGMMQTFYCHVSVASCSASITVPARKPWAAATHARWALAAQHSVHTAVAVLWKARVQGRAMQLPYELVEIVLKQVVSCVYCLSCRKFLVHPP
jgi:hypothetical protein